ncbi:Flagellin [Methylorubrum aminovorans]
MTALTTLRAINSDLETTQNRISTGKAVSSAADNAAYWSISTTMNSDVSTMKAVTNSLGLAKSQADTAANGINSLVGLLKDYRDRLASAAQPGMDKEKIGTELGQLKAQMETIVNASATNGVNWLTGAGTGAGATDTNFDVVSGVTRGATTTTIEKINISFKVNTSATATPDNKSASELLTAITGTLTAAATTADIETSLTAVDNTLSNLTKLGSMFGASSTRIQLQTEFTKTLSDSLSRGVGSLVDADLDAESTKLKALQTQQQLAVQALSIANSNTQTILSLFRN